MYLNSDSCQTLSMRNVLLSTRSQSWRVESDVNVPPCLPKGPHAKYWLEDSGNINCDCTSLNCFVNWSDSRLYGGASCKETTDFWTCILDWFIKIHIGLMESGGDYMPCTVCRLQSICNPPGLSLILYYFTKLLLLYTMLAVGSSCLCIVHCGDQRHLLFCLGYVPALAYGSYRVSDQGTTLRASDLHNVRANILNPFVM